MLNRNDNDASAKRLHQVATQNYYRQAELLKRPVSASPVQTHHHMAMGGGRMLPTPNMYIRPYHQSNPDLRRGYSPSAHMSSSPSSTAKLVRHSGLNKNLSGSGNVKTHATDISSQQQQQQQQQQHQLQQQLEDQNKNHNQQQSLVKLATERMKTVSYTHLTLPTIYSV